MGKEKRSGALRLRQDGLSVGAGDAALCCRSAPVRCPYGSFCARSAWGAAGPFGAALPRFRHRSPARRQKGEKRMRKDVKRAVWAAEGKAAKFFDKTNTFQYNRSNQAG